MTNLVEFYSEHYDYLKNELEIAKENRDFYIARYFAEGFRQKDIAKASNLSVATVKGIIAEQKAMNTVNGL